MFVFSIFANDQRPQTLCRTCVYAQLVEGNHGERMTACTYGFTLRPIAFRVADCTTFCDRTSVRPQVVVTGFLKPTDRNSDAA